MNWQNYAGYCRWRAPQRLWVVDHIIPKVRFEFKDVKIAYALTNLRPLWIEENIKKAALRFHLL